MDFQVVDPGDFPEWDSLLLRSNDSEFFHTSAWAKVLRETYGYRPVYHVLFEADRIAFLMPLMEIRSFLTGTRGVSLPFTDQCPLYGLNEGILRDIVEFSRRYGEQNRWRYIEWRDGLHFEDSVSPWDVFYSHEIDLSRPEQAIFSSLSENNRRNIRKSQKEGVVMSIDRSRDAIREFYRLNLMTRQRHGLPPQPFSFFKNVLEHILSKEKGLVALASHKGRVIAASVFFHHAAKALYKYGASDFRYQNVRPNNLVMWEALKWYRDHGFHVLNLGRTELTNSGLLQFKRTWGGEETILKYYRYDLRKKSYSKGEDSRRGYFEKIFARTPKPLLRVVGSLFYKHVG